MSTILTTPAAPAPDPVPTPPAYVRRGWARQGLMVWARPNPQYGWLAAHLAASEAEAEQYAADHLKGYETCRLPMGVRPGGAPANPLPWRLPRPQ